MRQVIYSVANSLDNLIARPDGGVDWLFMDGDYGMDEFFKSVDALLLGRKTYQYMLSMQPPKRKGKTTKKKSAPGVKTYVFSRTLRELPDDDALLVSDNAADVVRRLKDEPGKNIWLMGGGELAGSLLSAGVVDEISLAAHPVLLGAGIPLFGAVERQVDLALVECKPHPNGVVQLTYRVRSGTGPRGR